jgi:hypothetical protein
MIVREPACRSAALREVECDDAGMTTEPTDPATWTVRHFSQSNPTGTGQGHVAALLRRVADSIDSYGDIQVEDITFHSAAGHGEDELTMTVYYHDEPRRR